MHFSPIYVPESSKNVLPSKNYHAVFSGQAQNRRDREESVGFNSLISEVSVGVHVAVADEVALLIIVE
jgi:hypothetical protein